MRIVDDLDHPLVFAVICCYTFSFGNRSSRGYQKKKKKAGKMPEVKLKFLFSWFRVFAKVGVFVLFESRRHWLYLQGLRFP